MCQEGISSLTHCNTLHHTATHCNTLQHTAAHCNTLQHTATHCNTLQHTATHSRWPSDLTVRQVFITALHCNSLQHPATHCNTPQHTATHHRWPRSSTARQALIDGPRGDSFTMGGVCAYVSVFMRKRGGGQGDFPSSFVTPLLVYHGREMYWERWGAGVETHFQEIQ